MKKALQSVNLSNVFKNLIAVAALILLASSSQAATLYVNDGSTVGDVFTSAVGSNSNAGTASAPYLTINYAVSQATNGDIIMIDAGTYYETLVLNKLLTLKGTGSTTIITQSAACVFNSGITGVAINVPGTKLFDLKLTNFDKAVSLSVGFVVLRNVECVDNCNYALGLGNGASNFQAKLCKFNNNKRGINIGTAHNLKKIVIDSCEIKGNEIGINVSAGASGNMFDTVYIGNTDFSNNTRRGMYFEKLSNAIIENNIINNSGTSSTDSANAGIDINLRKGSYSNVTIRNNHLTNCGALGTATNAASPCALVVKARDDNGNGGSLNNLVIINNYIQGPRNGLRLGVVNATNSGPTNVVINNNNFGNGFANKAMLNFTSNSVSSATCNWFGSINQASVAALVNGSFTYIPYLTSGADNSAARGFQPTPVTLTASAGADKKVYYGYDVASNTASLTASVSGGSGVYSYNWSPGGATTQTISVTPTTTTDYIVTVTDVNGCVNSKKDTVRVNVVDIRCSNPSNGGVVTVCQATLIVPLTTPRTFTYSTQCVAAKNVKNYIPPVGRGYLGPCTTPKRTPSGNPDLASQMYVMPNPSTGVVNVVLPVTDAEQTVRVINSVGQVVHELTTFSDEILMDLSNLDRGVYFIHTSSSEGSAFKKLVLN